MTLAPTLWRTCRALANRKRLCLLHVVMMTPSVSVSDIANALQWRLNTTSQYLRSLNARGLLRVKREKRFVLYEAAADISMPETGIILKALRIVLRRTDGLNSAFEALTSFTHPRRIELLKAINQGAMDIKSMNVKTGISRPALERHLRKLKRRGCVASSRGAYRCACPKNLLTKTLLTLALQ